MEECPRVERWPLSVLFYVSSNIFQGAGIYSMLVT